MENKKQLIDVNKAFEVITDLAGQADTKSAYAAFWKAGRAIQNMDTVDAIEVVYGHWNYVGDADGDNNVQAYCSVCGAGDQHATYMKDKVPYCWHCGAKMNKGV